MKRTVKQWCGQHGLNWLGQGCTGGIWYDWKLVLGKGRTAIFSTKVTGGIPETRRIGTRDILVFPNPNRARDGGRISETAFLKIIHWVEDCLAGNVRGLNAPDKEVRVAYGTAVDISADSGKIVIHPRVEPEYRFEDLLKGVTKRNIHSEVETGEAVGREVW